MANVKCLSVRQPYASQIVEGSKRIEYRPFRTNYRGRVYIQASGKHKTMETGVVLGSVEIVDCIKRGVKDFEWILKNPVKLSRPLKCKGQLNIYNRDLTLSC